MPILSKVFISIAAIVLIIFLVGGIAGYSYLKGRKDVYVFEFKIYGAALMLKSDQLSPQLREFIKARYYNLSTFIPENIVRVYNDYGAVDTTLIKGIATGKGDSTPEMDYDVFKKKRGVGSNNSTGKNDGGKRTE